jgi:4-hydroxy-2-oxoheptanedioate aldolase
MGYGGNEAYVDLINDTVVAVMIEKKGAVDDLDEILDIPGVEMVQWGGTDYSMSVGLAGQRNNPDILAARNRVFKAALDKGVPPRAEVQTPDDAKEFLDMGVRHFSIGTDITILYGWWQENGEAIWKTMEDAGAGRVE